VVLFFIKKRGLILEKRKILVIIAFIKRNLYLIIFLNKKVI
jgi:hypothetical protein